MHILLEEAPLLVYYFLTLFLSNYKLRLILSIFWTTSTFCQLELPCSLRSLRSLLALAYARAESSLRSLYNKRSLRSHLLYSLVPSISIAPCEFAFRFAQYNSRIPFLMFTHFVKFDCPIAMSILPEEGALFGSLRLCNRLYYHFLNSLVQSSLCSKKFFHKIVSSDVLHIQGTSALGCSTLLLWKALTPISMDYGITN